MSTRPSSSARWRAALPASGTSSTRWLVLEDDSELSGGWFLYGYATLDAAPEFDNWYLTRREAMEDAEREWGVPPAAWTATE